MSGKGSNSRMPDECLMKRKGGCVYCIEYQAVMRKFTLAGESFRGKKEEGRGKKEEGRRKREDIPSHYQISISLLFTPSLLSLDLISYTLQLVFLLILQHHRICFGIVYRLYSCYDAEVLSNRGIHEPLLRL